MTNFNFHMWDFLSLMQSQCGFMSVSCTLNTVTHQQNFTFCMKPLGERRKEFHYGETFWHSFMRWKLCETPIETQLEFYHATM
jgi:hypothetical protein